MQPSLQHPKVFLHMWVPQQFFCCHFSSCSVKFTEEHFHWDFSEVGRNPPHLNFDNFRQRALFWNCQVVHILLAVHDHHL